MPIGVGLNTGTAFVGVVGSKDALDFTALGDPVNIAAHLASQAAAGEILLTEEGARRAGLPVDGATRRSVTLKGFEVDTFVLSSGSGQASTER